MMTVLVRHDIVSSLLHLHHISHTPFSLAMQALPAPPPYHACHLGILSYLGEEEGGTGTRYLPHPTPFPSLLTQGRREGRKEGRRDFLSSVCVPVCQLLTLHFCTGRSPGTRSPPQAGFLLSLPFLLLSPHSLRMYCLILYYPYNIHIHFKLNNKTCNAGLGLSFFAFFLHAMHNSTYSENLKTKIPSDDSFPWATVPDSDSGKLFLRTGWQDEIPSF